MTTTTPASMESARHRALKQLAEAHPDEFDTLVQAALEWQANRDRDAELTQLHSFLVAYLTDVGAGTVTFKELLDAVRGDRFDVPNSTVKEALVIGARAGVFESAGGGWWGLARPNRPRPVDDDRPATTPEVCPTCGRAA